MRSVTSWALWANSSVRGSAPFPRYSAPTRCMPISQWRRNHRHTCLGKSLSCFALAFAINCASDGSEISFRRPLFCLAAIGAESFPGPSTLVTFRDNVCKYLCVVYDLTEACVYDAVILMFLLLVYEPRASLEWGRLEPIFNSNNISLQTHLYALYSQFSGRALVLFNFS